MLSSPHRGSSAHFPTKKVDVNKARQYLGKATFFSVPPAPGYLPLLEINSMPGLRMHEFPAVGQAVPLASLLLDAVFE